MLLSPFGRLGVSGGVRPLVEVHFAGNALNYDLEADLIANYGWSGTTAIDVFVRIANGIAHSNNAALPAFTISDAFDTTHSTVRLVIENSIDGAAGPGSTTAGVSGARGGTALFTRSRVSIDNRGRMGGGGGGGGKGGTLTAGQTEGGGETPVTCGNQLVLAGGNGGAGVGSNQPSPGTGQPGLPHTHCTGSSGTGGGGGNNFGVSGSGATNASLGTCNCNFTVGVGSSGGPAGYYVDGFSFVSWIATGTRLGASIN